MHTTLQLGRQTEGKRLLERPRTRRKHLNAEVDVERLVWVGKMSAKMFIKIFRNTDILHQTYFQSIKKYGWSINYLEHPLKFGSVLEATRLLQLWDHGRFSIVTRWHVLNETFGQHFAVELLEYILVFDVLEYHHLKWSFDVSSIHSIVWVDNKTPLRLLTTWFKVSSSSASSGFLLDFFSSRSQYLASSSGDLLLALAAFVTALAFMKRPQALSSAATKPLSLLKATRTRALYFLCTSRMVLTYTFGSLWALSPHLSIAARPGGFFKP